LKNLGNILVTGGAGFIGSNLIEHIIDNYRFNKIISIDNYYTGKKINHHKNNNVIYLKLNTVDILTNNKKK
jgi:dTDP-D-glucose 4,6-dehydratase